MILKLIPFCLIPGQNFYYFYSIACILAIVNFLREIKNIFLTIESDQDPMISAVCYLGRGEALEAKRAPNEGLSGNTHSQKIELKDGVKYL